VPGRCLVAASVGSRGQLGLAGREVARVSDGYQVDEPAVPPPPPPDDSHVYVVDRGYDELSRDHPTMIIGFPVRERPLPPLRGKETSQGE
jgi:hypothetical protein